MNKLENTPENKARFFALYYGIPVLRGGETWDIVNGYCLNIIRHQNYHLELTPLSQIRDEDLDILVKILRYKEEDYFINNFGLSASEYLKDHIQDSKYGFLGFCSTESYLILEAIDYLRSKGYALPWMGLSVDDLVNYGWVKLKGLGQ